MLRFFFALPFFLVLAACMDTTTRNAGPLNQWDISCGADAGSIRQTFDGYEFRTSSNYCSGGTFNQRAEINTENFPTNRSGAFLFSATVAMSSPVNREFSIFSIHDGRNGCAPPLQLFVRPDGRMYISSDVKTGSGESCIEGVIGSVSQGRILRDGTDQLLEVLVQFDGAGGFGVTVTLDGEPQINGRYQPSSNAAAILSERFYFKHGVYSKTVFEYLLRSSGMQVVGVQ